ncbi:MAG: hypothetical protein DRP45_09520 [Candidatus Zixiibacteriota bacterium]|nr:MAG: hypothetical protein DRP45_09520 [candidate division Zixibacteria bacterium]
MRKIAYITAMAITISALAGDEHTDLLQAQGLQEAVGWIYMKSSETHSRAFVAGQKHNIITTAHTAVADTGAFTPMIEELFHSVVLQTIMPEIDIAVYRATSNQPQTSLQFGRFDDLAVGDSIWFPGFETYGMGVVSYTTIDYKDTLVRGNCRIPFIQFMGKSREGYSGTPVFNFDNEVIALIARNHYDSLLEPLDSLMARGIAAFSTDTLITLDTITVETSGQD